MSKKLFYLEDLFVGQTFLSGFYEMDLGKIQEFARQFDPQPFHLDPSEARESFFGELVASGWHTACATMRLMVEGGIPIAGGLVGIGGEIHWPKPTRPGDVLQVFSEILEITPSRSRLDRGIVLARCETRNQNGEVAQVFSPKMVVRRRG